MEVTIEKFTRDEITEELIIAAARFFSKHYGVWGPKAESKIGTKPGSRIKMSAKKLIQKIIPSNAENFYVRMVGPNDLLLGNVFATRYVTGEGTRALWVTQLCVHSKHRWQGIAYWMLEELRGGGEDVFGILSSHPYAIRAFTRAFEKNGLLTAQRDMVNCVGRVKDAMDSWPVSYVNNANRCGQLFEGTRDNFEDGEPFSCADTGFWVDHSEPDAALKNILLHDRTIYWPPFGRSPEGHEYLVVIEGHGNPSPALLVGIEPL